MSTSPASRKTGPSARKTAVAAGKPPPALDAATQVLRRFRLVFNAVKGHFQQVEKRTGLGGAQLWALSVIGAQPGVGVGDLALAMDIHQSTASNLVKALVARDLVQVDKGGADRRSVQLQLRPAGAAVLKKAPGPFTGVLPQAIASLDARTLKRLDADLAKLIDAIGMAGDERGANIPLGQ